MTSEATSRRKGVPLPSADRWFAFAFGVIFVSVLLYLARVEQNPTPLAIRIYLTVLAIAAAGVGAILPGFLEIRYRNLFRTGGALALGALVYLNEPAIGATVVRLVEPGVSPKPVVENFFEALDSGEPARSWALLPDAARQQVSNSEATWNDLYRNTLSPLGKVESRTPVGENRLESPPGIPVGIYKVFSFRTKRADDSGARMESVMVRANSSEAWEIFSYQISATTLD
jgi:hypothetical protein